MRRSLLRCASSSVSVVVEEIGAGVLHALVEEEPVEVVAEVVVVRDVGFCALPTGFACWKRLRPREIRRSTFCSG